MGMGAIEKTVTSSVVGRILAALSCTGALLAFVPGAQASPGDDARIVAQPEINIPSNQIRGANVQCGPGESAIGGGVGSTGSPMTMTASAPRDENGTFADTQSGDVPRRWFSEIVNNSGGNAATTFFAICSASSDATLQVTPFTVAQAVDGLTPTRDDETATCPGGRRAIGGGVDYAGSIAANQQSLRASGPLDSSGQTAQTATGDAPAMWYSQVWNSDPGAAHDHHVAAVCSPTSQATVRVEARGFAAGDTATLTCPAGSRATSGGAISAASLPGNATNPVFSGPTNAAGTTVGLVTGTTPGGWVTGAAGATGADAVRFSVVCDPATPVIAPPVALPAPIAANTTGQRAAALKKCKKKSKKKKKKRKNCRRRAQQLPA